MSIYLMTWPLHGQTLGIKVLSVCLVWVDSVPSLIIIIEKGLCVLCTPCGRFGKGSCWSVSVSLTGCYLICQLLFSN